MPLFGMGALAIGSIAGGLISGAGAQSAGAQEAAALQQAAANQMTMYHNNVNLSQPYRDAGTNATNLLGNYLGANGTAAQSAAINGYQTSPFFNQMVKNAGDTTMAQYAGKGQMGGNALNALYNQNAGLWQNQYNTTLGQLSGLSNTGAGVTNSLMGNGTAAAAQQGNLLSQSAQAQAAGNVGLTNALGSAVNNAGVFGYLGNNAASSSPGWQSNFLSSSSYNPSWSSTGLA